jgi:hypothetical protein
MQEAAGPRRTPGTCIAGCASGRQGFLETTKREADDRLHSSRTGGQWRYRGSSDSDPIRRCYGGYRGV